MDTTYKPATVEELIAGQLERMREPDFVARVKQNIVDDDRRRISNRPKAVATMRRYERRNPEKIASRKAVMWAVKRGEMQRGSCSQKDSKCFGGIEAHHHAGYSWEHRFDVIWLCKYHHMLAEHPR